MSTMEKYRHEFKYFATDMALSNLKLRLSGLLKLDSHIKDGGKYLIRSIYFDSAGDRCLKENETGIDPREKFRIRSYDAKKSFISLECKQKKRSMTRKISEVISLETFSRLVTMKGHFDASASPLVKKLEALYMTEMMSPKIIVQYERTPYVCPLGNVRITFDRNIAASSRIDRFFEQNIYARPALPSGIHLLEVKYDEYLPDFISSALYNTTLEQTTFSKYYYGRLCLMT